MLKFPFPFVVIATLLSCSNNERKPEMNNRESEMGSEAKQNHDQFKPEMVVNTTDFVCGMPVSAGIIDTAHFEGKTYGFCSSECKSEFKKGPTTFLAPKQ